MDYAVITLHNNQYLVKAGEKITAPGILGKVGDVITDAKTLLVKDGDLKIGTPTVEVPVQLKIVAISKTDKVDIFKYRGKSRYRRHTGHRQDQTELEVMAAVVKSAKEVKREVTEKPVKTAKVAAKTKAK